MLGSIARPAPECGHEAAPLADRQMWWWATVPATGGGIALIV
jgi:predicted cobalt transporter CbtA